LVLEKDPQNGKVKLLGFSDASKTAYGACIYLRSKKCNAFVTRLLIAKSRVAPEEPLLFLVLSYVLLYFCHNFIIK